MNRLEATIFIAGIGILALGGCSSLPEPIEDHDVYVGGKVGSIAVKLPQWNDDGKVQCKHPVPPELIVYCEDGGGSINHHKKPKPDPKPKPEPKPDPKQKGNNGWGNGDQSAPGKSLNRNQAENNGKGREQRNHGKPNQN